MNCKKIFINILKNKLYFSTLACAIFLIVISMLCINTIFLDIFKNNIKNNILNEVKKVSTHLNRNINFKNIQNKNDDVKIKMIIKDFKINKLHYISKDSKIIYSTQKNKIGTNYTNKLFFSALNTNEIYSKFLTSEEFVLNIYIPIIEDKKVTAVFEYNYDLRDKYNTLNASFKKINLYASVFNSIVFLLILFILYSLSKNNLKNIQCKKELKNFKDMLNHTNGYIYTKDDKGCYTFANQLVLDLFKISLKDLIGKDDSHFFDLDVLNELKKNDEVVLKDGILIEKEENNLIKDGSIKTYWTVKKPLYNEYGVITGISGISTDISELKELENEIKKQKQLLNVILDNVDAYIYIKDINRNFRYVNANTAELFGKKVEDIIDKQDRSVLPIEMADIFWESDKNVFALNKKITTEETIVDPSGQTKHYWSIKVPYTFNNEKLLIGFSSDITEIHILKEKLKKEVITDSLTNIYNKRHFDLTANSEYNKSKKENTDLSIVIIDIDYFKNINDTYGHNKGDFILKEVSKIFQLLIRRNDTLCRIGGEEFVIILPSTSLDIAKDLAENIRIKIKEQEFVLDDKNKISITVSLGVSSLTSLDKNYEDILLRADKGLYKSKQSGRNKTTSL